MRKCIKWICTKAFRVLLLRGGRTRILEPDPCESRLHWDSVPLETLVCDANQRAMQDVRNLPVGDATLDSPAKHSLRRRDGTVWGIG